MVSDIGYGRSVDVAGLTFDAAVERVKSLLKDEGFGVLCEIDVGKTLREKLGADFRPYRILGACNPQLAHRALEAEPQLGLLLPCNVVVQAVGGKTTVSVVDAGAMLGIVGNPELESLAADANDRLARVLARLSD